MKTCSRCSTPKPLSEFQRRARSRDGLQAWCKGCMNEAPERRGRAAAWHRTPKGRRARFVYQLQRRYGLTPTDFDALICAQLGRCATCDRQLGRPGVGLHVDHDHATGAVRGLLCVRCNTTLGRVEAIGLHRVLAYLGGTR